MKKPIKDSICFKKGIHIPEHKISQINESFVALIKNGNEIVCWALMLRQSESIIREYCKGNNVHYQSGMKYELHIFTKRKYRGQGLASQLVRSIKRKYKKRQYFGYWAMSSIFQKYGLVKVIPFEEAPLHVIRTSTGENNISQKCPNACVSY